MVGEILDDHRLFPIDGTSRSLALEFYQSVKDLPIVSPHGHTDPRWFAEDQPFPNPAALLIQPDHYIYRMLYSQGVSLESLGIGQLDGKEQVDPREVWQLFANNYFLFRGTPVRMWFDYTLENQFGLRERLSPDNAAEYYDEIHKKLQAPSFRPRALFESFRIEVLATTDAATDTLCWHRKIRESGWNGRVIPTFRPDSVIDAEWPAFEKDIIRLGELTKEDISTYAGYLHALRQRRGFFKQMGATATDHGPTLPLTADLSQSDAAKLYDRIFSGRWNPGDAQLFQAQMLTEMAAMSVDDGLVMQLHAGSVRNHNAVIYRKFGRDRGADLPAAAEYVQSLRPLLNRFGNERNLTFVVFTLDEATISRELAPLAGHYPCLRLGPPWWFYDSPEGMMRFRKVATETTGFYNTAGFNDDTRAFLSIPARHDMARRVDSAYLAELVADHRLDKDEAFEVILDLTTRLVKKAYKLESIV